MLRLMCALCLPLAIAAGTTGCGNSTPTTPSPTPNPVTVIFAGTLAQNGAFTHRFTSQGAGEVTATLTTIQPDSAVAVGLSLGTWNGNSCTVVTAKDSAVQGSVVIGNVTGIGELCVRIYDVGLVVEPTTYEMTVAHP